MKQYTNILAALILGISIIVSSFIIRDTFSDKGSGEIHSQPTSHTISDVMTLAQLSEYLQISEKSIQHIINEDSLTKASLSSYDTYRFIPSFRLDNQTLFLKSEIDEWLKYQSVQNY